MPKDTTSNQAPRSMPAQSKASTLRTSEKSAPLKITPFPAQQAVKVVNRLITFLETK